MKVGNFLVIANKRCATSWLKANLSEHPDIFMSSRKGLHFFDWFYDNKIKWYDWVNKASEKFNDPVKHSWLTERNDLDIYSSFFAGAGEEKMLGEVEHSYFWNDHVPSRIHKTLGVIPLILSLRQPVDRAYSAYQLNFRYKYEQEIENNFREFFLNALNDNDRWHNVISWGRYGNQLKKYLDIFPIETFHIIKYEDIIAYPVETMKKVYQFLGVDDSFEAKNLYNRYTPATNTPEKTGSLKRYLWYTSLFSLRSRQILIRLGFRSIKTYRRFSPPPLDNKLKKELTRYFDEDIHLLMDSTNINFSSWLSKNI